MYLSHSPRLALMAPLALSVVAYLSGCGDSFDFWDDGPRRRVADAKAEPAPPPIPVVDKATDALLAEDDDFVKDDPSEITFRSSGPRFGLIHVSGDAADTLEEEDMRPLLTAWGWQFEYAYQTSPNGMTGLVEIVPMIVGLEQSAVIPSLSVMFGLRAANDLEFGIGPNLSMTAEKEAGLGMAFGVGYTYRAERLNMPVNLVGVFNQDGTRIGISFGWNLE
jgi:hypothetical protein